MSLFVLVSIPTELNENCYEFSPFGYVLEGFRGQVVGDNWCGILGMVFYIKMLGINSSRLTVFKWHLFWPLWHRPVNYVFLIIIN